MDGMIVQRTQIEAFSQDTTNSASFTINLPSPLTTVAEISVSTIDYLYGPDKMTAYGVFMGCVTDGSTPPLPAVEVFGLGSISGRPRPLVIRNGLKSISYEIDVQNCSADFLVNLFFWPAVDRGNA
jgi:hypothetical protein